MIAISLLIMDRLLWHILKGELQVDIKLIKPTMEYEEDIWSFRQEILDSDDKDKLAGCQYLEECASSYEWIEKSVLWENVETCPEGHVPSNVYIAVRQSDNRIVGIIDLRHHINHPVLELWGGHIGYCVRPDERKKGYAREMLRLNLQNCRDLGIEHVMVTCNADNIASERTIIANGGIFEKVICVEGDLIKRFWINLG